MALPPFLPGPLDAADFTGAAALGNEVLVNPPSFPTGGTTGTFSGGVFTSAAGASPTLTCITTFPPHQGRRYYIRVRARKIFADPALPAYGSAVKPSFILFGGNDGTTYTSLGTPGVQDGTGGQFGYTTNGAGEFDTIGWTLNQWYDLVGFWDSSTTPATKLRVRLRLNRAADASTNLNSTQGSQSVYEVSQFIFQPPLALSDIQTEFGGSGPLSNYYRGGAHVPNTGTNSTIPTSGTISFSNFYGGTA